jgi:hypothetical protein
MRTTIRGNYFTITSRTLLLLPKERGINAIGSLPLHIRRHMRIHIGGDLSAAVPKSLADDFQLSKSW